MDPHMLSILCHLWKLNESTSMLGRFVQCASGLVVRGSYCPLTRFITHDARPCHATISLFQAKSPSILPVGGAFFKMDHGFLESNPVSFPFVHFWGLPFRLSFSFNFTFFFALRIVAFADGFYSSCHRFCFYYHPLCDDTGSPCSDSRKSRICSLHERRKAEYVFRPFRSLTP